MNTPKQDNSHAQRGSSPRCLDRLVGVFVTAKLTGVEDCRQGWVKGSDPFVITGESGTDYVCEGEPVVVKNPPMCPGCNDTGWQPLSGCPGAKGACMICHRKRTKWDDLTDKVAQAGLYFPNTEVTHE